MVSPSFDSVPAKARTPSLPRCCPMIFGSILWFPVSFVILHSILYVLTVKLDLWFFEIVGRLSMCGVNPLGRKLGGGVRTYGV